MRLPHAATRTQGPRRPQWSDSAPGAPAREARAVGPAPRVRGPVAPKDVAGLSAGADRARRGSQSLLAAEVSGAMALPPEPAGNILVGGGEMRGRSPIRPVVVEWVDVGGCELRAERA